MAKLTRKSYKRRKIIMGVTLFGAVGLVSTGFAAWVLSAGTTEVIEGSLTVGTVSDTNMEFTDIKVVTTGVSPEEINNNFVFEPAKNDNTGRLKWDGNNYERLSLTVTGRLTQAQNLGKFYVNLTTTKSEGSNPSAEGPNHSNWETNVATAISDKYVVAPEALDKNVFLFGAASGDIVTDGKGAYTAPGENDNNVGSFTYTVAFEWGEFFGGLNPSVFFDLDGYKATRTYSVGDYVIYGNRAYKCSTAVSAAEEFDSTKWTAVSPEVTRATWSNTDAYEKGDIVMYGGKAYEYASSTPTSAAEAPATNSWDAAKWRPTHKLYSDEQVVEIMVELHDLLDTAKFTLTIFADPA